MVFRIFSEKLQKLVRERGFLEPTLPQKIGIPEIVKGRNVLIIAPTGIGKTECACLGLFDKIAKEKAKPISMLYITPLRSLNRDMLDRLVWWADKLDLEISVRHGDTKQSERKAQVEMPPHIMITTPETLQAILTGKRIREHLKNVKFVVIDEIHELVESKRGIQLSLGLERLRELAGNFQRIGLSATVGSPKIVADFLGENVKIISADAEKQYNIKVESPKPKLNDRNISDDLIIGIQTTARLRRLYDLIQSHQSIITFTNTRETAEVLSSRLRTLDMNLKQSVHHGSLSKERRIKSEQEFKSQLLRSLIATSSLELGIDIGSIDLVVQYLSPRQVCRLIQRTGRAGHHVGKISKGIILSGEEDVFESIIIANRAINKNLEEIKIRDFSLDVLANQIIGMLMEEYEMTDDRIFNIVKRAYPYRAVKKIDIRNILEFLELLHLLWLEKTRLGYIVRRKRKAFQYYFDNLSTIPTTSQFKIISIIEHEPIGTLDEAFIAEHGHSGEKFVCSGRAWKIIQIDGNKVIVEPIEDIESAIPAWEGEMIPVPFEIAQDVGKMRRFISENDIQNVQKKYNTDKNSVKEMMDIIEKQKKSHEIPDDKKILIESYKDFIIIHLCSGSLTNDTIGRYLSSIITAETGVSVNMKTDPYRIILQTVYTVGKVKTLLENAGNIEEVLLDSVEQSSMFKWRFLHVARRFGIISKTARYDKISMNKIISQYVDSPAYKETLNEIFHEKMNIENAKYVFEKIKSGKLKIKIQPGLSILGELGLTHQFSEVMKPRMPENEIFNAFKRRLLKTHVRLMCTNCGEYMTILPVQQVDDQPECPKCTSRLIGVANRSKVNAIKILKKRIKKKSLTDKEQKEFLELKRTADLVVVYGKTAVITLAGRGVGSQRASRIMAMLHPTKEKLYKDILKAEKDFARTKVYWK